MSTEDAIQHNTVCTCNSSVDQGFSNFLVLRPISKKFFLGDPLMDSLDVNDTCKCPIVFKKFISGLSSQFVSRPQTGLRPIV